jgi:hypothetical protein
VHTARLPARHGGRLERWLPFGVAAVTLQMVAGTAPLAHTAGMSSVVGAGFVFVLFAFLGVGVMLTRTRPRNPIGWLMLAASFFGGVTAIAGPYAVDAYRLHHHLPLAAVAVLLQPSWAPTILLFALSLLLFPDGVLPSGRWRWALWALVSVGAVWMIGAFAIAGETIALHQVVVEPSGDLYRIDHPTSGWAWWSVVQIVFFISLLSIGLLWLVSRVPA